MTKLQEWLRRACDELGLHVDFDEIVHLPSGRQIVAPARIADLGGSKGTLIFRSHADLHALGDAFLASGYGYSVLAEPGTTELFSIESYVEMFSEWGWTGSDAARPQWLIEG